MESEIQSIKREIAALNGGEYRYKEQPTRVPIPKKQIEWIEEEPKRPQARPQKRNKSAEQVIGKTAMGIGASILVFIALIMFATQLLPLFGDVVKMVSMYLFSFLLIAIGEYIYQKEKSGYTILTGCGVGALFISIVTTYVYFKFIGVIPLYILLALWVFGIAFYLAKNRNLIFIIVGQAGIITATVLSLIGGMETNTDVLLMFLFIAVSECAFWGNFYHKSYIIDIINSIGLAVSVFLLDISTYLSSPYFIFPQTVTVFPDSPVRAFVIIASVFLFMATAIHLRKYTKSTIQVTVSQVYALFTMICVVIIGVMIAIPLPQINDTWGNIIPVIYAFIMICVFEKYKKRSFGTIFTESLMVVLMTLLVTNIPDMLQLPVYLAMFFLLGSYSIIKRDVYFNIVPLFVALALVVKFAYDGDSNPLWLYIGSCALLLHMVGTKLANTDKDAFWYELLSYPIFAFSVIVILRNIDWFALGGETYTEDVLIVAALTLIQLIVIKLGWGMSKTAIPAYVINGLIMCGTLNLFWVDMNITWTIVLIMTTALLFSINIQNLLQITRFAGAYIAFKYSALIIIIMQSFDTPGQIISIALIIIAAISIMVGFGIGNKSVRLYGLILSIISVAKLVLVDITYDNSLTRAFSFLICGLICFGISILYNYVEKNKEE